VTNHPCHSLYLPVLANVVPQKLKQNVTVAYSVQILTFLSIKFQDKIGEGLS